MNQHDPNPPKDISIQEVIYLSESSYPQVRQYAQNVLSCCQQSFENKRRCEEQNRLNAQRNQLQNQLRGIR